MLFSLPMRLGSNALFGSATARAEKRTGEDLRSDKGAPPLPPHPPEASSSPYAFLRALHGKGLHGFRKGVERKIGTMWALSGLPGLLAFSVSPKDCRKISKSRRRIS